MAHTRRLYKSPGDKMISGVSGGMAEYFSIDPVFVRLGWVASVFVTGGLSVLAYLVMAVVVPKQRHESSTDNYAVNEESAQATVEPEADMRQRNERRRYILGIGLVALGIALLMYNLDFFGAVDWGIVAAISVIGIGAAIIYTSMRKR